MASAFGHGIAAVAIGKALPVNETGIKFWLLGIACSILPDADVISFWFGIPYEDIFGHRGITHSFFFAFVLAVLVVKLFYSDTHIFTKTGIMLFGYFFLCTASHAILDAMTTGGRGVAFFAPFDNSRYFLPWRPIKVSPLSVGSFFSEWGWRVLKSELIWIGIPSAVVILFSAFIKRLRN